LFVFSFRWVAGVLNSVWRAMLGMLIEHPEPNPNPRENIVEKFKTLQLGCI
jgi:hypothetical protein